MKKIYSLLVALAFALTLAVPASAHASTYTYDTYGNSSSYAALQTRLAALIAEVQRLQTELSRMHGSSYPPAPLYPAYTNCADAGYYYQNNSGAPCFNRANILDSVEVDFERNFARVRIEYNNGRSVSRIYAADTREEVIDFVMSETGASRAQISSVMDDNGNGNNNSKTSGDVDRIRVRISSGDAHVTVYYEDDETDTFTIDNETNHSDIIEEAANELNMDESDVDDVIEFENDSNNNDDVDSIHVTIDEGDNDARAVVRYENGNSDTFNYNSDDEDEIIEELADELAMDEDDIEDLIDFNYRD